MYDESGRILEDHKGRSIRLTDERRLHLLKHFHDFEPIAVIGETLGNPESIVETVMDSSVHIYHRYFTEPPIDQKYLLVAVKIPEDDAFILTAFLSRRMKKGKRIWPP